MRRRTVLIAAILVLAAALWGWRSGAVRVAGDRSEPAAPQASVTQPSATPAAAPVAPQTDPTSRVETTPGAASAAAPETAAVAEAAPADPANAAPGFDVVRVEPDGSAVIAGRAKPNEVVTLRSGATALAEVRAGASGEFVLDLTLPVGEHRLQLSDAANALSRDAAVVSVPARERPDDLLVLMDRPGQASEIIVGPQLAGQPTSATNDAGAAPVETAAVTSAPASTPVPAVPAEAEGARSTLGVEAVEVENQRLSVAGAAPEGSRLKVYLDDKLVGEAGGTADDRFIANAMAEVSVGSHTVRIDEIGRDGTVVARAEVPFTRPDDQAMAAIAPAAAASGAPRTTAADTPTTGAGNVSPSGSQEAPQVVASALPGEAGAPPTIVQPALEAAQAKVIIRRGDSLWRVSRRAYGQGVRYTVIYLANGDQIRDPDRIYPGQVFRMPDDNGRPPRT